MQISPGQVSGRQACPCGSGRRYKACHGRGARTGPAPAARPFAGRADEVRWVALREVVPAATAPLRPAGPAVALAGERPVTVATVLPLAWAALVRDDSTVLLAAQTPSTGDDVARELGATLLAALAAPPGEVLERPAPVRPDTPALPELVADGLELTVHEDFGFWQDWTAPTAEVTASLERANAAVQPCRPVPGTDGAFLTAAADRQLLRWILPQAEDTALSALARVAQEDGGLRLGEDGRFVGSLRTLGLLVAVWELPTGRPAEEVAAATAALADRVAAAAADPAPLPTAARRVRAGLVGRQLTLH